jgi:Asp/Glu/hydantoin racemase
VILNETGFWRLAIAGGIGLIAAGVAVVINVVRKDPGVPIVAGVTAAATAYAIDLWTERKQQEH